MNAINLQLLEWIAAGEDPWPLILLVACALAVLGGWVSAGVVIWSAWRRPAERGYIAGVALAAGVAEFVAHAIASHYHLPRPFMLGLTPGYIDHGVSGSMPSTHATVMFLVATAFLLRRTLRSAGTLLLALAAGVGWARVYVGVHFPFDIVAGLLLALALSAGFVLVRWAAMRVRRRKVA